MRMKNTLITAEHEAPQRSACDGKPADKAERTKFCASLDAALEYAAPQGATVFPIGFSGVDRILRAGYRIVSDADEADIIAARGGENEFARARKLSDACDYIDSSLHKKTLFVPTHALLSAACSRYRAVDGTFAYVASGAEPTVAVFDPLELDNLASIFGELVSLDLAAFDYTFGAHMQGLAPDVAATNAVARLVTELTDELRGVAKDREKSAKLIAAAGARAARIVADRPEMLHCSGAAQTAEALRMLYAAELRPLAKRGETEMLLAVYVADFYVKNIGQTGGLTFPPDNNKRIDSVCEYFAADLRRACVYAAPIYPPIKMRLCEYRRAEFRADTARMLAALKTRQNAAWKVFKRLYPDDGYGLKTLIDPTDLPLVLALAPDVFSVDTMLSFLKQTGKLDRYIV